MVDATLRDLIHRQAGELELERYVRQHSAGIRSNGIEKVLAGETSLDEVLRVLNESGCYMGLCHHEWLSSRAWYGAGDGAAVTGSDGISVYRPLSPHIVADRQNA